MHHTVLMRSWATWRRMAVHRESDQLQRSLGYPQIFWKHPWKLILGSFHCVAGWSLLIQPYSKTIIKKSWLHTGLAWMPQRFAWPIKSTVSIALETVDVYFPSTRAWRSTMDAVAVLLFPVLTMALQANAAMSETLWRKLLCSGMGANVANAHHHVQLCWNGDRPTHCIPRSIVTASQSEHRPFPWRPEELFDD